MKLFKFIYLYIFGYVDIKISGFFVERFINLCFSKSIFLWKVNRISSTDIKLRISKRDFKKIKKICKASKCKIKILSKNGLPFLLHKYKKRKIFAIALVVVAILILYLTRFVWNIEIQCDQDIDKNNIIKILNRNGIEEGKSISNINTEKAINDICMNGKNISWCGIKIKGTNVIVNLEKENLQEEIIDNDIPCDIIAKKNGIITKITARNGTINVKEGDLVKEGDILINGIIEGKYTETRRVSANRRCNC